MTQEEKTKEFIKKAKVVHGDTYDYSKVIYTKSKEKVKIICPEHGIFEQIPYNHYGNLQGCPQCGFESHGKTRSSTKEHFIKKAKLIHGDKYDYSLVEYVNNSTKVKIICVEHGIFEQKPNNHYSGKGCPQCGSESRGEKRRTTTEEFIEKAKLKHGDRYLYDKVEYTRNFDKVSIICPEHGIFEQEANSHLSGSGCPSCQSSKGEEKIRKYLTDNNIEFETEKTFDDCKNKQLLRFDFYIPSTATAIEFDGIQHYKPSYFGSIKNKTTEEIEKLKNDNLKINQKRDKIKTDYCYKNGIYLIRIKYDEFEHIEDILQIEL